MRYKTVKAKKVSEVMVCDTRGYL